jgi:hypothetical protein
MLEGVMNPLNVAIVALFEGPVQGTVIIYDVVWEKGKPILKPVDLRTVKDEFNMNAVSMFTQKTNASRYFDIIGVKNAETTQSTPCT